MIAKAAKASARSVLRPHHSPALPTPRIVDAGGRVGLGAVGLVGRRRFVLTERFYAGVWRAFFVARLVLKAVALWDEAPKCSERRSAGATPAPGEVQGAHRSRKKTDGRKIPVAHHCQVC